MMTILWTATFVKSQQNLINNLKFEREREKEDADSKKILSMIIS